LTGPTTSQIAFTAPEVGPEGARLTFMLTVSDTHGIQSLDKCNVNVNVRAGADLTGTWASFSHVGSTVAGALLVQNIGSAKVGRFQTRFYLSDDGATPGQLLSRTTIDDLGAAKTNCLRFEYQGEANLTGKHVVAVIDWNNQIEESNEDNNDAVVWIP
jgi:hypothetical protein